MSVYTQIHVSPSILGYDNLIVSCILATAQGNEAGFAVLVRAMLLKDAFSHSETRASLAPLSTRILTWNTSDRGATVLGRCPYPSNPLKPSDVTAPNPHHVATTY